jgi:hypothetical protein
VFNPIFMLLAAKLGRYISGSGLKCKVCGGPAERQTTCCKVVLCEAHLQQWLNDRRPCPCKQ